MTMDILCDHVFPLKMFIFPDIIALIQLTVPVKSPVPTVGAKSPQLLDPSWSELE